MRDRSYVYTLGALLWYAVIFWGTLWALVINDKDT